MTYCLVYLGFTNMKMTQLYYTAPKKIVAFEQQLKDENSIYIATSIVAIDNVPSDVLWRFYSSMPFLL